MLKLDVAIVTHRPEGLVRVAAMDLPAIEGVRYVVSWQNHEDAPIPDSLMRDDIAIYRFDGRGISRNRNNAYEHCTADIVLNSDDDLIYTPEQLKAVVRTFDENPDVDLATFMADMPGPAVYPKESTALTEPLPKGYWVVSFTMAFRRKAIGDLRMHPDLGLGAEKMHAAEEELFLLSAIRRGLNCRFFPVTICTHPDESTGTQSRLTPPVIRAMGCYIAIATPKTLVPRIVLKALRLKRSGRAGFISAIRYLAEGARLAPAILNGDRRYLWHQE